MTDPRAGAEDWESVDQVLWLRTPEEEMSGEWKPPTPHDIALNRARYTALLQFRKDITPEFRDYRTAHREGFYAGFAAGVAHVGAREDYTCMVEGCEKPAIVGSRKSPSYRMVWSCGDHFTGPIGPLNG